MKKILLTVTILIFLTSCSSVKKAAASENIVELNKNNTSQLIGIYENKPLNGDAEIYSLWSTLNFNAEKYENWENLKVELKINTKNQVVAELISNGERIATKLLKGKIERGFYRIKNQFNSDFSYVILWVLGDSSVKLGITENQELIVLRECGGFAFLVAFPIFGANTPLIETKYKNAE